MMSKVVEMPPMLFIRALQEAQKIKKERKEIKFALTF